MWKKNMSCRIHATKVKGSRNSFIRLIRNKRNYRHDLDLLIDEGCEILKRQKRQTSLINVSGFHLVKIRMRRGGRSTF